MISSPGTQGDSEPASPHGGNPNATPQSPPSLLERAVGAEEAERIRLRRRIRPLDVGPTIEHHERRAATSSRLALLVRTIDEAAAEDVAALMQHPRIQGAIDARFRQLLAAELPGALAYLLSKEGGRG